MTPDTINALFELGGALLTALNIRALLRDKTTKGVVWPVNAFFTAWGAWNLYYYPALGQWISFAAGVLLVAANAVWVGLAVHYASASRGAA